MNFLLTKKLKYFITVMEKRCLNKACEELFITRSPLGKAINELETSFGKKLFLRQHGLFTPTEFALDIYEIIEPLYKKIINVEEQLTHSGMKKITTVILDSAFPENLADIIQCSLGKNFHDYNLVRLPVNQDTFENDVLNNTTLIISTTQFPVPDIVTTDHHVSSSLLLITNKEHKDNFQILAEKPLLLRENMVQSGHKHIAARLENYLGFRPKIRGVNGTLLDFLVMISHGHGFMLMPLTTCEMMNINRENTILMEHLKIDLYYYHRTQKKPNQHLTSIKKHISKLL